MPDTLAPPPASRVPASPQEPITLKTAIDAIFALLVQKDAPRLLLVHAARFAQAILSHPPFVAAVRAYNAAIEAGDTAIPLPSRAEMERFHDLLQWSVRPDSLCEMTEQTANQYVTIRGTLCYVLGHEHDRDALPATVANIERIMVEGGYEYVRGKGVVKISDAGASEASHDA